MSKLKWVGLSFLSLLLLIGGFLYSQFFGLPWEKIKAEKILTEYVEEKYEIDVTVQKSFFNFKDGSYGVHFISEDNLAFTADYGKHRPQPIWDYYPEAVWNQQMERELGATVNKLFPTHDRIVFSGAYGVGHDLKIGKEIPPFDEVNAEFDLYVGEKSLWSKEKEIEVYQSLFALVEILKNKEIDNLNMMISFHTEEDTKMSHYIHVNSKDLNKIHTWEDIKTLQNEQ
ncbi:hypothetical protein SM124_06705 [Bacillus sp. 31A1R]|uniref:YfjL-like N-terminal domain-containing protein n=1 Tax=Robertmurraya mangrovi TaxID=3098077 RepID=A0ABU5IWC3_9BACI|nr:hypothetical protein [Bacillus sp. 31A1R]MDZ5471435.1 hypothetical protein [Bacillus sp. 31A1R]